MADFWSWWQHLPQNIDPVIFAIGSFKLREGALVQVTELPAPAAENETEAETDAGGKGGNR